MFKWFCTIFLLVTLGKCLTAKQYVLFNHEISVSSRGGLFVYFKDQWLNKYVTLMGGVKRSKPASAVLNLLYTESLKTQQDLPKTSSQQAQLTENYT